MLRPLSSSEPAGRDWDLFANYYVPPSWNVPPTWQRIFFWPEVADDGAASASR